MTRKTKTGFLMILFFALVLYAQSQQGGSIDITSLESGMRNLNSQILNIARRVVQLGLFIYCLWTLIQGYLSHSLQTKWMNLVGAGLFIAILQMFPQIYQWITGVNPVQ